MIWKIKPDLEALNSISRNTMLEHLDIKITEVGDDYIKASMPVDHRTHQPMGLLHGGASVALAESMGSIAGALILDDMTKQSVVGTEISAHHLRSVSSGLVHSITKPIKIGRTIQLWRTEIYDDEGRLLCTSELSTMIVNQ